MTLSEAEEEYLRNRFAELLQLGPDSSPISNLDNMWLAIKEKYGESQRFYHTLRHIFQLMQHFDTNKDHFSSTDNQTVVLWAIFFHDIIYDPSSKTNEDESAVFFRDTCSSFLPTAIISKVFEYIIATKHHKQSAETTSDPDLKLFLDMDLSILAADAGDYEKYAQNIRQEYICYDNEAYKQGRSKVLETFLGANQERENWIFASEHFRLLWETKAKENLQFEFNKLQSGELM